MTYMYRLWTITAFIAAATLPSVEATHVVGCSMDAMNHLAAGLADVNLALRSIGSVDKYLAIPTATKPRQGLHRAYFGDVSDEDAFVASVFENLPQAIEAATFSCINDTFDPWGQREQCDIHVALTNHERNQIILCPSFLETKLLRLMHEREQTVLALESTEKHLALHVLIHELAHTSVASSLRRVVDWFLLPPLTGSDKGKFAYGPAPVQELACMSPKHSITNADNLAWYATSVVLSSRLEKLSESECRDVRRRWNKLVDPESFLVAT